MVEIPVVLSVDEEKHRVSLGIKQLTEDPWIRAIPEKYIPGQIVKGRATKLTNFGVFIELEPDLEGLLHISEIADHKIESPQEVVKLDEELEVKILRVDSDSRKIGLSLRRVQWTAKDKDKDEKEKAQDQTPQAEETDTEQAQKKRGGLDGLLMPEADTVSVQPDSEQASEEKASEDKAPEPAVNSEQAPEQLEEPAAEDKEPEAKTEEPAAEDKEPEVKTEEPVAEDKEPEAKTKKPKVKEAEPQADE